MITLDGYTLESFGLIAAPGHEHQFVPATADRTVAISGLMGLYDFGADLKERPFNLPLAWAKETNRIAMQLKARTFIAFLFDGQGRPRNIRLVFDYEPDVYYDVRYSGGAVSPERLLSMAFFSLPLVAFKPLAQLIVNAGDITMGDDILLERGARLDDQYSFEVSSATAVEVNNFGTVNAKPVIEITGSFTTLSISANGKTFNYNQAIAGQTLTVDNERYLVKIGTTNKLAQMTGDFIELPVGVSDVTISGTGLACTVSFIFKPKFI